MDQNLKLCINFFEKYCEFSGWNTGSHVVIEDFNLSEGHIQSAIDALESGSFEYTIADIEESDVKMTIAFLRFLLTVPEYDRDYPDWRD